MVYLAFLLGLIWRRWWGAERPSWAFPGFRWMQAALGLAALFGVCVLAGHSYWSAAIRACLAIGFLAAMAESIPHIWRVWEWIDAKVGVPNLGRLFYQWTNYAEATCGGVVWALVVVF